MAADAALHERRADRRHRGARRATGRSQTLRINRLMTDGVVEAPNGAHFTECVPDYERDEAFQKEYAATARDRRGVGRVPSAKYLDCGDEAEYQRRWSAL